MRDKIRRRFLELCELASVVQDREELAAIAKEIATVLEAEQKRLARSVEETKSASN